MHENDNWRYKMIRYTHDQVINELLSKPENMEEYKKLEEEFALFEKMLQARISANKTQEDVAKALHTTRSVVSRLENSGGKKNHSPTITTLRKYAEALNCELQINFVPRHAHAHR